MKGYSQWWDLPRGKRKGITVNFFNYLDATLIAHKEQAPKEFPHRDNFWDNCQKGIKKPKAHAIACIKCTDARGVTKQQTEGVIIGGFMTLANGLENRINNTNRVIKMSKKVNVIVTQLPTEKRTHSRQSPWLLHRSQQGTKLHWSS